MNATFLHAIQALYIAYFGRAADPAGLAYWHEVVQASNGSTSGVAAAFAASAEYRATFEGKVDYAIIGSIYQNLFSRAPDSSGQTYWASLLGRGELSIDTIVRNIAEGAQRSDKTTFENKIQAALALSAELDSAAEQLSYSRPEAAQVVKEYLYNITTDASLAAALAPPALAATVAAFASATAQRTLGKANDSIVGSAADDSFSAPVVDGRNTFRTGDIIHGGAGEADRLSVQLVKNSDDMNVTARTSGIELITLQAVARPGDLWSPLAPQEGNRVDALNMQGVRQWESTNSSGDLQITNIRLLDTQSTRDVRIVMRETAPGDTDLSAFFTTEAQRSAPLLSSTMRMQMLDLSGGNPAAPLEGLTDIGVAFYLNGTLHTLISDAFNAATTYPALVAALQAEMARVPALANVTVSLGSPFYVKNKQGVYITGTDLVLHSSDGGQFGASAPGAGFLSYGAPFPKVEGHYVLTTLPADSLKNTTASLVLDDVGRGGTSGGLMASANRYEIEVQDSSKLQLLGDDRVEEIVLRNGLTTSHNNSDPGRVQNEGDLSVMGDTGRNLDILTGSSYWHVKGAGLSEVRVFDASAMLGKVSFTAAITDNALARYLTRGKVDAPLPKQSVEFVYSGGADDDVMQIQVSGNVLASNGKALPQGDVLFKVSGGEGNDSIKLTVVEGTAGWYGVQHGFANLRISAGGGDDTVVLAGAGDAVIDLGAGNDSLSTSALASDAVIQGGAGDDRIVLGTAAGSDLLASSNDTLLFGAGFGKDVLVNFSAGGNGADRLDFSALGGKGSAFAGAAVSSVDQAITVQQETAANDTAAEIAALYADGSVTVTRVFVAVDAANVGKVYAVADSADGAVAVTLVGSIDLAGTPWSTLTSANFA